METGAPLLSTDSIQLHEIGNYFYRLGRGGEKRMSKQRNFPIWETINFFVLFALLSLCVMTVELTWHNVVYQQPSAPLIVTSTTTGSTTTTTRIRTTVTSSPTAGQQQESQQLRRQQRRPSVVGSANPRMRADRHRFIHTFYMPDRNRLETRRETSTSPAGSTTSTPVSLTASPPIDLQHLIIGIISQLPDSILISMGSENGENCTNSSNEIRLISVNGESRLIRLSDTLSQTIVTAIRQLHPMIDQHSPGWQDQIMGLLESRCPPLPIATTFTVDNTAVNFDATEPSSFVDKSDCGSSVITSYPLDYTQDSISSGQRTKLDILAETARDCFERDCRVPGWPKLSLDVDANGKAFVAVVPDAWL